MEIKTEILHIETHKEFEIINITKQVKDFVENCKIKKGFINVFARHTTFAIKINEDEKLLMKDFMDFLDKLTPKLDYHHDNIALRQGCPENEPKNTRGHLRVLALETSQIIPISNGKMQLGTYQNVFAIEGSGPRKREIVLQVVGE